jgi:hypothetical protein
MGAVFFVVVGALFEAFIIGCGVSRSAAQEVMQVQVRNYQVCVSPGDMSPVARGQTTGPPATKNDGHF